MRTRLGAAIFSAAIMLCYSSAEMPAIAKHYSHAFEKDANINITQKQSNQGNAQGVVARFEPRLQIADCQSLLAPLAGMRSALHQWNSAAMGAAIVGVASMYNPYRPGYQEGGPQTASGERYDSTEWAGAIQ